MLVPLGLLPCSDSSPLEIIFNFLFVECVRRTRLRASGHGELIA